MRAAARAHGGRARDDASVASIGVSLWVRLLESHNLMLAEVRRRLADDCTMPRFDLLANLEREDGQTLASLSRRMLVTAGNLTGLVDRAERDGVVERRADPRDRRLSRVYLTPKGRELVQRAPPAHAPHVAELLAALDASERRELRRLLGKLREALVAPRKDKVNAMTIAPEDFRFALDAAGVATITLVAPGAPQRAHLRGSTASSRDVLDALERRGRRARRRHHRRGPRVLLGRRRRGHHRRALRARHAGAARVHARHRRAHREHPRACAGPVVAAVNGVGGRRRRGHRARVRSPHRERDGEVRLHLPARSASAAPTWARRTSCRASSASGARASSSSSATSSTPRRRCASASSTASSRRTSASPAARALAERLASGPAFAHAMTKQMLESEHGDDARAGDRGRGAGAGDLHAAPRLPRRVRRVEGEAADRASTARRGITTARRELRRSDGRTDVSSRRCSPFFDDAHRALGEELRRARRGPSTALDRRRGGRAGRARPAPTLVPACSAPRERACDVDVVRCVARERSRTSRRSPTRSSPCRGSARIRSLLGRSRRAALLLDDVVARRSASAASRSPSPRRAATSRRCGRRRAATATAGSSTARRPSSPTSASRTTSSSSRTPIRRAGKKGISAFLVEADAPGLVDSSPSR